ncbi:hypothetical protein FDZ73_21510 [bacterium]|jgi:hypothetical protein|nr:MAG: hypothetical protein FDZ73_21510 [bacterium]
MSSTLLIHLLNEDPILAEVDELPTKTDTFIMVKNPRRKDGKDLPYLDNSVTNVIWPLARVSFIEIMPGEKDEEIVSFVRE